MFSNANFSAAKRLAIVVSLLGFSAACGRTESTSRLNKALERETLQFVVMGGNSSCHPDAFGNTRSPIGNDIDKSFRSMLAEVNTNDQYNVKWIISCHRNGNAAVYYATSESQNQVFETTVSEYIKLVVGNYITLTSGNVFVAGHSYGGWLAMKTVLALKPGSQIGGVYTIDPISRVHCTFSNPSGCNSAPQDISNPERRQINTSTGIWGNYYQTKTFYLHSAPMEEADENLKLNVSHTQIDNDPLVWMRIRDTVKEKLARSLVGM